ncbi:MAG: glycosyltransferase [Candidatus Omnitrophota bacterium]
MENTNKITNIFILIDALGWEYIRDRHFLNNIAVTKMPVKSILGFSSGVIPSILTGKYPQEHKHWSLYFYSPKTSPFRWTKALLWLPDAVLNLRITRKIIEEISKHLMGYTGYFETYLIPVAQLYLYDICERKNIYASKGIEEAETIFDILEKEGAGYRCFAYPLKDKEIITGAKESIEKRESDFYFLYLSEFDALLHSSCKDRAKVNAAIDGYEGEIKDLYRIAKDKSRHVNLYIFSDHGMAPVEKSENLKAEIEKLRFTAPNDYVPFYDSTMARFWFFNQKAKSAILDVLKTKSYGRILPENEIKELGIDFSNDMYGEVIFLMDAGVVINPSFMGNRQPQGMHGFDIKNSTMDAVLVSNQKIEQKIDDVKDFFKLMAFRDSPLRGQSLKVLYFLNSVVRAGVEEHVLRLIEGLDKTQFEPILICPRQLIEQIKPDLERLQIKFYSVDIRRWRNLSEIKKFMGILKEEKPDIVHSHLFFATRFAAPLAKLAGIPVVIDTSHLREAWRKGIKRSYFVDRFFYRFVDKIIAVSNAVKSYLVNEKELDEKKIEVIHNGIDLARFKPSVNRDSPLRGQSLFTIGVIGRLEPQKGHKYFLDAVSLLDGKYDDVKFLIAGDGSLRNELERQAKRLGISERVEFVGYRRDIENVLKEIDLLVLPSLYEGLPLVALEAGAMGKPVIATNVDGSPEAVVNDKTGLIVPAKDSIALKEGIEIFLKNRELAKGFGENARRHIEERFDIRKQIDRTEQLYSIVVSKVKE